MGALHEVTLKVTLLMDEMDGSAEESALIALDLATEALEATFPNNAGADDTNFATYGRDSLTVEVSECREIES